MNDGIASLRMMEIAPLKEAMMVVLQRARKGAPPLEEKSERFGYQPSDPLVEPVNQLSLPEDEGKLSGLLDEFRTAATNANAVWRSAATSISAASEKHKAVAYDKLAEHYWANGGTEAVENIQKAYVQLSRYLETFLA
jgi:hypothetical protein